VSREQCVAGTACAAPALRCSPQEAHAVLLMCVALSAPSPHTQFEHHTELWRTRVTLCCCNTRTSRWGLLPEGSLDLINVGPVTPAFWPLSLLAWPQAVPSPRPAITGVLPDSSEGRPGRPAGAHRPRPKCTPRRQPLSDRVPLRHSRLAARPCRHLCSTHGRSSALTAPCCGAALPTRCAAYAACQISWAYALAHPHCA
jgi:hypothetical protein